MLFLLLQIGEDRYGLEGSQIVEVVPRVNLKKIPQAPQGIAGVLDYHGALVPVIDLSELASAQPSPQNLSTRLVLVNYPMGAERPHILGLVAERATETVQLDPATFVEPGVTVTEVPYLGPIGRDSRGLIQRLDIEKLMSEELRDRLFRAMEPV